MKFTSMNSNGPQRSYCLVRLAPSIFFGLLNSEHQWTSWPCTAGATLATKVLRARAVKLRIECLSLFMKLLSSCRSSALLVPFGKHSAWTEELQNVSKSWIVDNLKRTAVSTLFWLTSKRFAPAFGTIGWAFATKATTVMLTCENKLRTFTLPCFFLRSTRPDLTTPSFKPLKGHNTINEPPNAVQSRWVFTMCCNWIGVEDFGACSNHEWWFHSVMPIGIRKHGGWGCWKNEGGQGHEVKIIEDGVEHFHVWNQVESKQLACWFYWLP